MGCCESSKTIENEVEIGDKPLRDSDFYEINLESSDEMKGFDFEALHTNKSTAGTNRIDLAFLQTTFLNLQNP